MNVLDFEQGTPEWKAARAGRVTASRMTDVLAKPKKGSSVSVMRRRYLAQIIAEILTGEPQEDNFTSRALEAGIENEPEGRSEYEVTSRVFVRQVGFVVHPTIARAGCSPDGLVGEDGMVQIKCPLPHTHIYWMLDDVVPAEHAPQMHWELACCDRKWSDFVSYCPTLPAPLNLYVKRLPRDEKVVVSYTAEVLGFLKEADTIMATLGAPGHSLEALLERSLTLAEVA